MKKVVIILLLMIPGIQSQATDTYPKNPNIDIIHYSFSLTLSDQDDVIRGLTRIHFVSKKEGINQLRLDLINKTAESDGKGMEVEGVFENGRSLSFKHENDALWITLSPTPELNSSTTIEVRYKGVPATGLKIAPNKYNERTFFSDNWPNKARNWLPTVDHPYDKATSEMLITAPAHYQVISNGLLVEESVLDNGMKLTHWKQSVPIATWLYVLGVAKFTVQYVEDFQGKSIQTWVYHQDRDAGFYDFAVPTKDAMQFYTEYVGPYAYEKLANVQSNSVGGGMEAATAIFYDARSVTGERTERWQNVIIHEVAHQWFGNAVTEYDWDDVWLSEGFATYFTSLFIEHAYGKEKFVATMKDSRDKVYNFYKDNPNYRIVHDNLNDMSKVTTIQTYQKGAWILHMLRHKIGDQAFQKGIQSYYKKYFNSNAVTSDFIREMETASGVELDDFFKQWLYQGGNIELKGNWKYDAKKKKVTLSIAQAQKNYRFSFPLEVAIYSASGDQSKIEKVDMTNASEKFEFDVADKPARIDFDPNTKLLATWDVKGR